MPSETKAVQHTAAWSYSVQADGRIYLVAGDEAIGELFTSAPQKARANANLIAAAPELLEALEETGALIESVLVHVSHGGPTRADGEAALKRIQSLVRKAKGEL